MVFLAIRAVVDVFEQLLPDLVEGKSIQCEFHKIFHHNKAFVTV